MSELPGRMSVPPLEFREPKCSLCFNEVTRSSRRSYTCSGCAAEWSSVEGRYGEADPEVGQCTSECEPFRHRTVQFPGLADRRYRCVREAGHSRKDTGKTEFHVGVLLTPEGPDPDNTWEWEVVRG